MALDSTVVFGDSSKILISDSSIVEFPGSSMKIFVGKAQTITKIKLRSIMIDSQELLGIYNVAKEKEYNTSTGRQQPDQYPFSTSKVSNFVSVDKEPDYSHSV